MSVRQTIIDNLVTRLNETKNDETYEREIAQISLYDDNILSTEQYQIPLVMVLDNEEEILVVRDSTHYRYEWEVALYGLTRSDTADGLHTELNALISTLKKFVDGNPSLGTAVLAIDHLTTRSRYYREPLLADCLLVCKIKYTCANGSF